MKKITLTHGKFALVDDEDYEMLNKYRWFANFNKNTNSYYATRNRSVGKGKYKKELMHRVLLGLGIGHKSQVDHINHDTLDNRRSNLRVVTRSQNKMNSGMYRNNSSGYKGVSFDRREKKWHAYIRVLGKRIHLGYYKTAIDASQAYIIASKTYHGEFGNLG